MYLIVSVCVCIHTSTACVCVACAYVVCGVGGRVCVRVHVCVRMLDTYVVCVRACMHRCITNESNGVLLLQSVYSYDRIRSLTTEYVLLQVHLLALDLTVASYSCDRLLALERRSAGVLERSDSVVRGEREREEGESVCVYVFARALCVVRATEIRKGRVGCVGCVCGGGFTRMGVCKTKGM